MTSSLANDLCCMQLLYAQATQPQLRQITNSLYSTLINEPENRATLRDEYYIPNSALSIASTSITMSKGYTDNLVQISGSTAASVLVNQKLGEVAYRCVFTTNREPVFQLAGGVNVPDSAPVLNEQQQKALVLTLWHLALNDTDRNALLVSANKSKELQAIKVDGLSLDSATSDWIANHMDSDNIVLLKDFIGYYLYKATW
ncbi:hypothetical protein [Pseudoalteromonas sp. S16_S37]|uniref:hypothetical protein n=1 Tax=Pseudoalteromonas sp. S16_S37 TaxID=2720228 RepID=UPI001681ADC6|nr:hypothetical protein [Pseudoalteromonas sp. S16_S37]MBD1582871.1 hypothetical protein [Pseudoalteromonas sp. S16_S37]